MARTKKASEMLVEALRGLTLRAEGLTEMDSNGRCVACGRLRGESHKPLCEIAIARAALAKMED
jgi:hypothetical protein